MTFIPAALALYTYMAASLIEAVRMTRNHRRA